MIAIGKTATVSMAVFVVAHFLILRLSEIPRSTVIVVWAFTVVLLAIPRAVYRFYRVRRDLRRNFVGKRQDTKRVRLVGANDNADVFLKTINERAGSRFQVLAILDERGRRTGFFFQAEDGIRGLTVTGVQTCALPIWTRYDKLWVQLRVGASQCNRNSPLQSPGPN